MARLNVERMVKRWMEENGFTGLVKTRNNSARINCSCRIKTNVRGDFFMKCKNVSSFKEDCEAGYQVWMFDKPDGYPWPTEYTVLGISAAAACHAMMLLLGLVWILTPNLEVHNKEVRCE